MNLSELEKFNELLRLRKPFKWYTQKILSETYLFGKSYFWLEDIDGHVYLAKKGENGLPDLT